MLKLTSMDIRRLLKEGEGQKVEFKRKVTQDIGKIITAFANSEGGYILIGVDDDGSIVGVKNPKESIEKLSSYISSIDPMVNVRITRRKVKGREIIVVEIPQSPPVHPSGGIVYIRVGLQIRPLSIREITELSVEHLLISFDKSKTEIPFEEASEEIVEEFLEKRRKRGLGERSKIELFKRIGVIYKKDGKYYLTFGGALAFLENPQEYFPHTYIRIRIGENWTRIGGPIFKQIDKVMEFLYEILPKSSAFIGPERIDITVFPRRAIREAVVNAVAHRNYAIESEIIIKVNPKEIIIENPGSFPPGVTPEDPKPLPRNGLIYELLFQAGYVEKEGFGINLIKEECARVGLVVNYEIKTHFTRLKISLPEELDEIDKKILSLLEIKPMSSTEISRALGISRVAVFKRLKNLTKIGKVKRIGRGKNTKYLLT